MNGLAAVSRRLAQLDNELGNPNLPRPATLDIEQYVRTMAIFANPGTVVEGDEPYCRSPAAVDDLVNACALLGRLQRAAPEIVTGPIRLDHQCWVATDKVNRRPQSRPPPNESDFVSALESPADVSTKPFNLGLFTSTFLRHARSMWHFYLETQPGLFPTPWQTWAVEPQSDAVIHEITNASQWVDFVTAHPVWRDGLTYPDWASASSACDAVHMTVRAIVATQGLRFHSRRGITAPLYWDVESTLWLRWCFRSVALVDETKS